MSSQVLLALIASVTSLAVALTTAFFNRRSQGELEKLKASLAKTSGEETAKRDYEYDALKRLYTDVNPLLFQLREYCEGSAWRARRIICGDIQVDDGHHLLTSGQRLCAPLVVAQELQRHLTAVDLRVDPVIRAQYIVSKELLWNLHGGWVMAKIEPCIDYSEDRREHLTFAQLQRLIDALTVEEPDGTRRPTKQSELEDAWKKQDPGVTRALTQFGRLFSGASPTSKPILWRLLFAHACFMHVFVDLVDRNSGEPRTLLPSNVDEFRWPGADDPFFESQKRAAETYVRHQLTSAGLVL
jgi:hypothetical protein